MTKQETYISFILDQLNAGEVSFEKVFELNRTKLNLGRTQFSKYWKVANERHFKAMQLINEAKVNEYTENEIKAVKTQILSKSEKQEILSKIIKGELEVEKLIVLKGEVKKVKAKPDAMDIMKAIDIDNKMQGDYAPTNQNVKVETIPTPVIQLNYDNRTNIS